MTFLSLARENRLARVDAGLYCWTSDSPVGSSSSATGAFGMITKPAWLPYFGVARIPESLAYVLMPTVGTVDVPGDGERVTARFGPRTGLQPILASAG